MGDNLIKSIMKFQLDVYLKTEAELKADYDKILKMYMEFINTMFSGEEDILNYANRQVEEGQAIANSRDFLLMSAFLESTILSQMKDE